MVFLLYACCVPVDGARRSVICDLQRNRPYLIPKALFEILTVHADKSLPDIKAYYEHEVDETIDEYFHFLIENDLGFWTDEPYLYPPIAYDWESPSQITNAIVDMNEHSIHDFDWIAMELDKLGCAAIQLRSYSSLSLDELYSILRPFQNCRLRTIEILLKFSEELELAALEEIAHTHQRVSSIYIHSSPYAEAYIASRTKIPIVWINTAISDHSFCGNVNPGRFASNIQMFTESMHYNNCLNRKISIDADGHIKNCPAFGKSFGKIGSTSLTEVIRESDFKKWWSISKDSIDICRDCEFRYICTDCRAITSNNSDMFSKPAKCKYNPYQATWIANSYLYEQ